MTLLFSIGLDAPDVALEKTSEQTASQYLDGLGFSVIAYEGTTHSYTLTRDMLTRLPYMHEWALLHIDPNEFLGKKIEVHHNRIENIGEIVSLSNLVYLDLSDNKIKDITPLKKLENLIWLSVKNNPIEKNEAKNIKEFLKNLAYFSY